MLSPSSTGSVASATVMVPEAASEAADAAVAWASARPVNAAAATSPAPGVLAVAGGADDAGGQKVERGVAEGGEAAGALAIPIAIEAGHGAQSGVGAWRQVGVEIERGQAGEVGCGVFGRAGPGIEEKDAQRHGGAR